MWRITVISLIAVFMCLAVNPAFSRVDYLKPTEKRCIHCHVDKAYPGGSFFEMELTYKWVFMWTIMGLACTSFIVGLCLRVGMWGKGKRPSKGMELSKGGISSFFIEGLLQRELYKLSRLRWINYMTLSMGFLLLCLLVIIMYIVALATDSRTFEIPGIGPVLDILCDMFGLSVMMGVIISAVRRYIIRYPYMGREISDHLIPWLIFLIVLSGFLTEAFRLAVLPLKGEYLFSFVGIGIATLIKDIPLPWGTYHFYLWNIHFILAALFIAYLPFTHLFHSITCSFVAARGRDRQN